MDPRSMALATTWLIVFAACSSGSDITVVDTTLTSTTAGSASTVAPSTTQTPATAPQVVTPADHLAGTEVTELPGELAISRTFTPGLVIIRRDLSVVTLTDENDISASQTTWSPDGAYVAWSQIASDGEVSVVISSASDGSRVDYPTPFRSFYLQWRPDNGALGILGGTGTGTGLALIDREAESVTSLHEARSFYFHWAPDGQSMISHLDASRLELIDPATGEITAIGVTTGEFQAPVWMPDGESILYARRIRAESAGIGSALAAQLSIFDELVIHNLRTAEIIVVAQTFNVLGFTVSPDGSKIAFTSIDDGSSVSTSVADIPGETVSTIDANPSFAWQWSPDSSTLLLFTAVDAALALQTWSDGTIVDHASGLQPTATFSGDHLQFWGQYVESMPMWAPDSSAFVYAARVAGVDAIYIQYLDESEPRFVATGSMATFSPEGG